MSQCVLPPTLTDLQISEYMPKNKLTRLQEPANLSYHLPFLFTFSLILSGRAQSMFSKECH